MPYTNIHWIKLKLELLNDKRFIFDCNDNQKWLFIGLLLLAASTKNKTPSDENYLKNRLNLPDEPQKIAKNLKHLCMLFPKLINKNGFFIFKNFNTLHSNKGFPADFQRISEGTPKGAIEKRRIEEIRGEYIKIKGWDIKSFTSDDYGRTAKAIKTLILKANNDELVIKGLIWCSNQSWCDWTLETLIRRWPSFIKDKDTSPMYKQFAKERIKI